VVAPTDTIYGILADATLPEAVGRLYRIRRPSRRPFIVLLPDPLWAEKFSHLGARTVAVRYPRRGFVMKLLRKLNRPLVAPSANREGEPPARSVGEALAYFGADVDLYVEGDTSVGKASAVVDAEGRIYRSGGYTPESLTRVLSRGI